MEEYRDKFTSFEHDEKTNKVANTIVLVMAAGVILFYLVFGAIEIVGDVANYPVFAIVLGIAVVVLTISFVVLRFSTNRIDALERGICKRLDKQGYSHEKREGTLYITKNNHHFRVHLANGCDKRIKHLYFVYEFGDDNFGKVAMDGWTRAANSINLNNTDTTFVTLEDHFCCCYQTAIVNAKDFINEFDRAYRAIGGALDDYQKIYPYLERDYPNSNLETKNSIGFK